MTLAEKHVDPRVKRTRQLLQQAFPSGQMDAQHGVNQLQQQRIKNWPKK